MKSATTANSTMPSPIWSCLRLRTALVCDLRVRGNGRSDNARVRATVDNLRLYFDVEGCGLAAQGQEMAAKPALVLLHGGPGADHSLFKPEFSAMADAAQVVYLDQRGS